MKQATVIGGKGRIGSYLVPLLLESGYDVINVSRGESALPRPDNCWRSVRQVVLDRNQEDFPARIAELGSDCVIDMICFKDEDMRRLAGTLQERTGHYVVIGSLWMHGPSTVVPCPEHLCREPIGDYGIEKHRMDLSIQQLHATANFPGTIIHPGHIVAEGFNLVNPQGNLNLQVFRDLRDSRPLALPNFGMETLHHVHAADVAGIVMAALENGSISFGQGFHIVSSGAVTLSGYAREVARWFGQEAMLVFQPYTIWAKGVSRDDANITYEHIQHSPCGSMEKARRMLGFIPRYTSYQAIRLGLDWLIENGKIN